MSRGRVPLDQILEVLAIQGKVKEIHGQRELAHKRYKLQEAEFESSLQADNTSPETIEQGRQKLVAVYEQYIDSCLALRTYSISSEQKIEQMIKDIEQ